jgi:hypothetical protein
MTTRFIAVAGYVDRPAADGRILRRPTRNILRSAIPLPLMTPAREQATSWREAMGRIDRVGLLGDQIILTGIILEDFKDSAVVRELETGTLAMELDVDQISWDSTEPTVLEDQNIPMTFTSWRVRAATVGSTPCWDMPPVMIWTED